MTLFSKVPRRRNRLGNLAKYIVRTSFSQERLVCIPGEKSPDGSAKATYQSKDGRTEQTFDALDRLARLVVPIPNRYEQLAGYGGYYSNKSRGMRKRREPTTSRRRSRRKTDIETVPPQPGEVDSKKEREIGLTKPLQFEKYSHQLFGICELTNRDGVKCF